MPNMFDTTSTQKTKMPPYVKQFTRGLFNKAFDEFKGGPDYFKGSTVTPFSQQTAGAMGYAYDQDKNLVPTGGGMMGLAGANSGGNGMSSHLQGIMNNGGFNPGQMQNMAGMRGLADNAGLNQIINSKNGFTPDQDRAYGNLQNTVYGNNAQMQSLFNQGGLTGDQQGVASRYRDTMNSPFDLNSNPAYASVRQQALDTQANALSARAAAAGRYGGGSDQAILAREQGNLANRMDDAEYRNWQQRGDMAAGNLAGLSQTGIGNQMGINAAQQSGLQNIANMGNMGIGQRNDAIGIKSGLESQMFNMNQAGLQNMGQAYQTAMQPYQTQAQVGAQFEDLYNRTTQDTLRQFDASNPFNHLAQYASLLQGAPRSQVTTQSANPWMVGAGLLSSGTGLLGNIAGWGGSNNPAGSSGV